MTQHLPATAPAAYETKAASAPPAYDDLMRTFEAFKEANDMRLGEIEARMTADVLSSEKVDRINEALDAQKRVLDALALKAARPPLAAAETRGFGAGLQHKAAFETYVRSGDVTRLRGLEQKALSVASDPDGGYLVPDEIEKAVNRAVRNVSPIRAIAGIRQVSGSVYKKPFSVTGPEAGWVAENMQRAMTAAPTLAELAFPTMELFAMPAATSGLLDDSAVNIDQWIAEEVRDAFAAQEGTAFVSGNGEGKPKGFLSYPTVDHAAWTWGKLGTLATGVEGGFALENPGDKLIDLVYAVKAGYRGNGTFVFNRATQAAIRKMHDDDGNYLWQPAARAGDASTLMGFPIAESEDMPGIAKGSVSVAFGDFRRGYLVVDRVGIRVLRDPYSSKPYVLFYTTKRVGGGVQDFDAIKLLKFSA